MHPTRPTCTAQPSRSAWGGYWPQALAAWPYFKVRRVCRSSLCERCPDHTTKYRLFMKQRAKWLFVCMHDDFIYVSILTVYLDSRVQQDLVLLQL